MTSVTPTNLSKFEYCERAGWIDKNIPLIRGPTTFALVYGSATHDAFRVARDEFATTWIDLPIQEISQQIPIDVKNCIQYIVQFIAENHPEYIPETQRSISLLELALNYWGADLLNQVTTMTEKGYSLQEAIEYVLPITEVKLSSKELGLHGRADQIYFQDGSVIVTDLKSDDRITSFLHQEGHRIQLFSYGFMASETFSLPCNEVNILYTKSMETKSIPFDETSINYLKQKTNEYRETIEQVNPPPMLQGLEAEVKCNRCYVRKECFKLADSRGEIYHES